MLNLKIRNMESYDIEGVFEMHLQLQNTLVNLRPDINKKNTEISDAKFQMKRLFLKKIYQLKVQNVW